MRLLTENNLKNTNFPNKLFHKNAMECVLGYVKARALVMKAALRKQAVGRVVFNEKTETDSASQYAQRHEHF